MKENNTKEALEKAKLVLEQKKIGLEIKELEKYWFKKPSIIFSLIPGLVAIGSFIWVFNSGLLDAKATELRNQRHTLQVEIDLVEKRKKQLQQDSLNLVKSNAKIQAERDSLKATLAKYIASEKNGDSKQQVYIQLLKDQSVDYEKTIKMLKEELADRVFEIFVLNSPSKDYYISDNLGFNEQIEEQNKIMVRYKNNIRKLQLEKKQKELGASNTLKKIRK